MSINFQELRELLGAIAQTDITELVLKNDDFELTVRKEKGLVAVAPPAISPQLVEAAPSVAPTPPATPTLSSPETTVTPTVDDKKWVDVTSPMVGTFYSAPAPDEDPFVAVGDRITKGDTVCIIEAMKLMNEIEGEVTGQVMEIMVQNGEPVEFGQVLMRVKPG
ncbi:acetyl-CoA carboxylase, biotin carboxyl carrier protein [Pleurocapsa sp. CCALA 161]|uniref:acetyl-CoA carboxylase biotin carboxyl carrier protein n=1 Tax=Pleurocapsa sp. CCALA 161 TaxID=2107688 RepID=UPI000D075222|nr:acetyl-CoA carboxylase biotin carboxyl carrier protein [Pleurocapsa sp. CCALA 161]PSB12696.1 acetyl-CoA carboxylase, biotin carboxyl carrier protein [Pleurocapsa sp. CCALA 161]